MLLNRPYTRSRRLTVAYVLAIVVVAIDIATGSEIRVYPFYFIPIALASRSMRPPQAVLFATLCCALWLLSKYIDGTTFSSYWAWAWNTSAQFVAFVFVAILVSKLSISLARVTESTRLLDDRNAQLADKGIELEKLNSALSEALRSMEDIERIARHDLKTPLSSIAATPALLRSSGKFSAEDEKLLGMIENAANRALSMVNLTLSLRQMEMGLYAFKPAAVDLTRIVRAVAADIHIHAQAKSVSIDVRGAETRHIAVGEDILCYSLIANILKNAVEAAPDDSAVNISLHDDDQWISLAIANAGAVPLAIRDKFFSKYATHGKVGGAGLGAYSALLLAKAQGGTLIMESSEELGTTLTLRLRHASENQIRSGLESMPERAAVTAEDSNDILPQRALIVDDDAYNQMVLSRMLPRQIAVDTAINGRLAVEAVIKGRPDIIFMDIEMPVMGGIEALKRIREFQAKVHQEPSVIVAFSAHDDPESVNEFRACGFDAYLSKPCLQGEVMAFLRAKFSSSGHGETVNLEVRVDRDLLPEIPEFLNSRRILVAELRAALADQNRKTTRQLAHKLAGSLALFGFAWASTISKEIEQAAESGDISVLANKAKMLAMHIDTVEIHPSS